MSDHAACRCGTRPPVVEYTKGGIVCGRCGRSSVTELDPDMAWAYWDADMGAVEKAREALHKIADVADGPAFKIALDALVALGGER